MGKNDATEKKTTMTAGGTADVLQVRTLGSFSLTYGGVEFAGGKQQGTQIALLLQLLLHHRENGVSRDLVKAVLFEDREIEDVSHALRSIVYNTKRKLKDAGMPDVNYIRQEKGIYFWTDEIPVREDAQAFEEAFNHAIAEPDMEKRMHLLHGACHMYSGAFLPGNGSVIWISQEAKRYREMFHDCMLHTVDILREQHRYKMMRDLSIFASNVDPFAEWEVLTIESLVALTRFEEARQFYEEALDKYVKEFGNRSSEYVREITRKLGAELVYENESIDVIQEKLKDDETERGHGYYCQYPVFQELYRTVERVMERAGEMIFLMLCTIVDSKGNPMREGPRLSELSERLAEAIVKSVRHSDTVTKYGQGQFLVLLFNTSYENCSIIQDRIDKNFLTDRQRTGVEYAVNSVIFKKS